MIDIASFVQQAENSFKIDTEKSVADLKKVFTDNNFHDLSDKEIKGLVQIFCINKASNEIASKVNMINSALSKVGTDFSQVLDSSAGSKITDLLNKNGIKPALLAGTLNGGIDEKLKEAIIDKSKYPEVCYNATTIKELAYSIINNKRSVLNSIRGTNE